MGADRILVMGAELLCTKAKNSAEVSLLMANTTNINNALLTGRQSANKKNTVVDEDIIPFTKCKKTLGTATCKATIITADLWENLTLPYGEIKVPHINWVVSITWFNLERKRSASNLNDPADETQFLANYDAAKKDNTNRYKFSDEELRRNANLKLYTDSSVSDDACITVDSILPCLGYGGIIHPKTSGQSPVYSKNLYQLVLSLPHEQITEKAYRELARLFLYVLDDDEKATFISLCFDFKERVSRISLPRYVISDTFDAWQANREKFDKILNHMSDIVGKNEFQDLNLLHRYLLFDAAQFIREPTSEIGAGGPNISIQYHERYIPPEYVLDYKQGFWSTAGGTMLWIKDYNARVLRPSNNLPDNDQLIDLNAVVLKTIHEEPVEIVQPYGAVVGFARDMGLGYALLASKASSPAGLAVGGVTSAYDLMNALECTRQMERWRDVANYEVDHLHLCNIMKLSKGTVIYSDSDLGMQHRVFPTAETEKVLKNYPFIGGYEGFLKMLEEPQEVAEFTENYRTDNLFRMV